MKKHLLLASLAAMAAAQLAAAQDPGDRNTVTYSENLTLEWYGVPTGECLNAGGGASRSGIGTNGKFYLTINNKGVAVYNHEGQIKMIDNKSTWVSINCDDAGHVYFRNDVGGWPGTGGAYSATGSQFCVIDSKTDEIVKADIPMHGGVVCRFDALPHVMGNMMTDAIEIPVPASQDGGNGVEFFYRALEEPSVSTFNISKSLAAGNFPKYDAQQDGKNIATLGMCQLYEPDEDGYGQKMAVLSNNYVNITASSLGWGNNVALYEFNEEANGYIFSGKWFNTPNHSSIAGFFMFSYDSKNYIIYPTGMTVEGYPAGDGFFVMEEEFVDTPQNKTAAEDPDDWSTQIHKAVAYKYATEGIASGNNWRGINVEPMAGEDGKFRIYFYNPGKSMQVWQLDLTGSAGIEDIVADNEAAKIYGGVGAVIVSGGEKAQVYTVAGQLVAEGNGSIAVNPGVYVVKAGASAAKVLVR